MGVDSLQGFPTRRLGRRSDWRSRAFAKQRATAGTEARKDRTDAGEESTAASISPIARNELRAYA